MLNDDDGGGKKQQLQSCAISIFILKCKTDKNPCRKLIQENGPFFEAPSGQAIINQWL